MTTTRRKRERGEAAAGHRAARDRVGESRRQAEARNALTAAYFAVLSRNRARRVDAVAQPSGPGPSGKTWPRWPPHLAQRTSVRTMPWLTSSCRVTWSFAAGPVKLGQPLPLSNLVPLSNNRRRRRRSDRRPRRDCRRDAGEGALGAALAQHMILLGREALAPFGVGKVHLVHGAMWDGAAGSMEVVWRDFRAASARKRPCPKSPACRAARPTISRI